MRHNKRGSQRGKLIVLRPTRELKRTHNSHLTIHLKTLKQKAEVTPERSR